MSIYSLSPLLLWPTKFKFSGGDGDYRGVVYGEYGEDHRAVFVYKKRSKKWHVARKTHGTTGLILGMHTQLYSGSNMGWFPLGHTSFS